MSLSTLYNTVTANTMSCKHYTTLLYYHCHVNTMSCKHYTTLLYYHVRWLSTIMVSRTWMLVVTSQITLSSKVLTTFFIWKSSQEIWLSSFWRHCLPSPSASLASLRQSTQEVGHIRGVSARPKCLRLMDESTANSMFYKKSRSKLSKISLALEI